ncbi:MAG TPA: hypothetical protein VHO71_05470 [Caproiciproducens sp.]|nr:hypothetical protein [Caproiciproducens sp.]
MSKFNPADKESMEVEEKKQKDKFNTVTESVKPENQNQYHNVKKVALGPNTDR